MAGRRCVFLAMAVAPSIGSDFSDQSVSLKPKSLDGSLDIWDAGVDLL